MRFAMAVVVLSGCRGLLGIETAIVAEDAAVDADLDALVDAGPCTWMPTQFEACAIYPPQPPLVLSADLSPYTYNTTTEGGALTDRTGQTLRTSAHTVPQQVGIYDVAIWYVDELAVEVGATLYVIGSKPLLIGAERSIVIAGTVDAGSHMGVDPTAAQMSMNAIVGAGSATTCGTLSAVSGANAASTGGSGGGGGGAMVGAGGRGGNGDDNMAPGGAGGDPLPSVPLIFGGCAGATSGQAGPAAMPPATSTTRAAGGAGGGAIVLVARTTITVAPSGRVLAGGAGGAGGPTGSSAGGGGGGAGGYIAFDASVLELFGIVAANGGAGGGGSSMVDYGTNGADGGPNATRATGGVPHGACGATGGTGGAGGIPAGELGGGMTACGGGGGGGGVGYIGIKAATQTTSGAIVSPPATPL